ncbi:hypothetical protein A9Q96_08110 [Rhodobacterales bacterium 52_120_T64]|nr:hypothetical protein A9Q96_08110 [Rhodobacterales bacterium 52_120_T64]
MLTRFNHSRFHAVLLLALSAALMSIPSMVRSADVRCEPSLRRLVQLHNFPLAFYCAEQVFADNPDDMDALLVMARAAQELGRAALADNLASQARKQTLTTAQRFAAYLISGISNARQSKLITAKVLLYRASDFAQSEPELKVVRRTLAQLGRLSPWKFSAGIDVSPSANINSGSLHDTITFAGLEFVLDDDAKAQSGIAYSLSAGVTHQRRLSARTIWENGVSIAATVYDGRGRNDASYTVTSGLRYTPGTARPVMIYGYVRYDQRYIADEIGTGAFDEYGLYYNQTTAGLEFHRNSNKNSAWKVYGTYTDRQSDVSAGQNVWIGTLGATYRRALDSDVELAFGGYVQTTEGASNLAAQASNISLGVSWAPKNVPFSFSGSLGYTHTQYTSIAFGYSEARMDDDVDLELALAYDNFQFFGFKPTFGVLVSRDYSNLNRYDTQNAQLFTRLSAAF